MASFEEFKKFINYYYGVSKEACKWQKHFGITSNGVWYNSISDFSKNYKISNASRNCKVKHYDWLDKH